MSIFPAQAGLRTGVPCSSKSKQRHLNGIELGLRSAWVHGCSTTDLDEPDVSVRYEC